MAQSSLMSFLWRVKPKRVCGMTCFAMRPILGRDMSARERERMGRGGKGERKDSEREEERQEKKGKGRGRAREKV